MFIEEDLFQMALEIKQQVEFWSFSDYLLYHICIYFEKQAFCQIRRHHINNQSETTPRSSIGGTFDLAFFYFSNWVVIGSLYSASSKLPSLHTLILFYTFIHTLYMSEVLAIIIIKADLMISITNICSVLLIYNYFIGGSRVRCSKFKNKIFLHNNYICSAVISFYFVLKCVMVFF